MIYLLLFAIPLLIVGVVLLIRALNFRKVRKCFTSGNVCVTGLRGTGKDMLMGNVIDRAKHPYISNLDYHSKRSLYIPLSLDKLNVCNNYRNFIQDDIVKYDYPYPQRCDIFVSDCGVYFPSQYTSQLDKLYCEFPNFQALSRHLGDCNFHINAQNLNRVWNKIREQSDIYISTEECKCFKRFVFQTVTIYENYDSCVARVRPYVHIKAPLGVSAEARSQFLSRDEVAFRAFEEKNGKVKRLKLFYINKTNYDTRFFKKLLSKEV